MIKLHIHDKLTGGQSNSLGRDRSRVLRTFIAAALACLVLALSVLRPAANAANGAGRDLSGAEVFLRYCAGCHGFDGFSQYSSAPSFARGERLYKSDQELLQGVLAGRHAMPYWQDKLSVGMLLRAIGYLRIMDQRYRSGLPPREQPLPPMHYRFNPVGEDQDYWMYRGWQ